MIKVCADGFVHRILEIAKNNPQTIAINNLDTNEITTYSELVANAQRKCYLLKKIGIKSEDIVALCLPNGKEFVEFYLALLGCGAIPALINPKLTDNEFSKYLQLANPKLLIIENISFNNHYLSIKDLEMLAYGILLSNKDSDVSIEKATAMPINYFIDDKDIPMEKLILPVADQVVSIQFTYRGYGKPVKVAHQYRSLTSSSDGLHEHFHPQGIGSVHLVALPLYAIFGLTVLMVFPLSIGATMLITNTLLNRNLAEVLSYNQVSFACLIPEIIRFFTKKLKRQKEQFLPLHPKLMLYSGGGHLPNFVAKQLAELLGCNNVLQGYGLTESFPIIVQSAINNNAAGAMGKAISNVEIRVVDDHGNNVEKGKIGELIVYSQNIDMGYAAEEVQALSDFCKEKWLHTGDLVWQDDEGNFFFYCQRLAITKIKSQMVDLKEVDQYILQHPAVIKAFTYVERDDYEANYLTLCVVVNNDSITKADLVTYLSNYLSPFKIPKHIEITRKVNGNEHQ